MVMAVLGPGDYNRRETGLIKRRRISCALSSIRMVGAKFELGPNPVIRNWGRGPFSSQ
jgi:hypothetical protein